MLVPLSRKVALLQQGLSGILAAGTVDLGTTLDSLQVIFSLKLSQDLDLHRLQSYLDYMDRPRCLRSVDLCDIDTAGCKLHYLARPLRRRLVAVENVHSISYRAQRTVEDHPDRLRACRVEVRNREDFLIVQNALECQDTWSYGGNAEVALIARDRTEIEAAVAKGSLTRPDGGCALNLHVKGIRHLKAGPTPQCFSYGGIGACAMEALLGAVVDTGNAGKSEQTRNAGGYLVVIDEYAGGWYVADASLVVVIVQKRDEEPCGITVGTEHILFDRFSVLIHAYE